MNIERFIKKSNDMFLPYIKKYLENKSILDVGCGCGLNALFLSEDIPCKFELTDIQDLRYHKTKKFPFKLASKNKLPYDDNSFDVLLIQMILHHLDIDPIKFLKEVHRVTKDYVILIEEVLTKGVDVKDAIEMDKKANERLHPNLSSPVQKFFSDKELKEFIKKAGFKIKKENIVPVKNYLSFKVFILKK